MKKMTYQKPIKKNYLIQNLKALAIIIVVFGHSIIIYSSSGGFYKSLNKFPLLDNIKSLINIFQMPLFFSISGFLFAISYRKYNFTKLIFNKIKRLIVPFFSTALLWMIPIKMLLGYKNYENASLFSILKMLLLNIDSGHLWYLPTLFIIFMIMYIFLKLFKNNVLLTIIVIVMSLFANYINNSSFFVLALKNLIYFYMGVRISTQKNELNLKNIIILSVLITMGLIFYYRFNLKFLNIFNAILIVKMLYILMSKKKIKMFDILADNSFGIYLLHSPLIYITFTYFPNISCYYIILINFFLFGSISLIMTDLINKTKLKFLLGN